MNIKYIFFTVLLLSGMNLNALTVAIEMTYPLSALLSLYEGGDFSIVISKSDPSYGAYWSCGNYNYGEYFCTSALPQSQGYYANSLNDGGDLVDIVLQKAISMRKYNYFTQAGNSNYANALLYYSDVIRSYHSSPKGPDAILRGNKDMSTDYGTLLGTNFNKTVQNLLFNYGGGSWSNRDWTPMHWIKHNGVFTTGITLTQESFKSAAGKPINFYFAETGADIYLPLHMISPGDSLILTDPDYLNFGPGPNNYAAVIPDKIIPWTYSYMPRNIPSDLLNKKKYNKAVKELQNDPTQSTIPNVITQQIDF